MFVNEDLQKHFDGKSWYSPQYAPEEFDRFMLSDIEEEKRRAYSANRDGARLFVFELKERGGKVGCMIMYNVIYG